LPKLFRNLKRYFQWISISDFEFRYNILFRYYIIVYDMQVLGKNRSIVLQEETVLGTGFCILHWVRLVWRLRRQNRCPESDHDTHPGTPCRTNV
jgi:hypothetical protein